MDKTDNKEIILIVIMVILALVATDPFSLLMPSGFQMMAIMFLLIIYLIFSAFIWKENPFDEREELHKLKSGKTGFMAGSLVLIAGIVYQTLNHSLDSWLIAALVVMISAKAVSLYKDKQNN